ncbi:thiolase family protein [Vibrio sp. 99-70-13A1]|uniref:thiolase family protein n=1 Tax=Vibrio sp. 99-70-13A1 TaxID=2607601 RepID=UPI0014938827|nr:thiolase family protein [Vibrio sp. 99-70-13A1]NOH95535.1 thiolase family protein [Vibrio sp. 99-70-13A1]
MSDEIWIVSAKRTPMGSFQGMLSDFSAPQLGSLAIEAAIKSAAIPMEDIDETIMGCVLPAGCGQAPARQAALGAGLPNSVACTTINKVCGSGMKSVMLAHDLIKAGSLRCVVAGGMESMTNAPYLLKESRKGMRLGHKTTHDHMFLDGLQDAYQGELMGVFAQKSADRFQFSRTEMDEWAEKSVNLAVTAQEQNLFSDEMIHDFYLGEDLGRQLIDFDEHPRDIDPTKISTLRPAFTKDGTITAANSSSIADGAAAVIVINETLARHHGLDPLAIIKGHATHAREPAEFTLAPVFAIQSLLSQLDWDMEDVDLWEINEAFAVVTQIAVKQLGLEPSKVNVKGGACALGHPIGASGTRILVTLIHSLRQLALASQKSAPSKTSQILRGVASLCIGGGEATAVGIEVSVANS